MPLLFVFAVVLLAAVLISGLAERSVLSTAVLFLVAGFVVGSHFLGIIDIEPTDQLVSVLAVAALFSILFTDGMHIGVGDLRQAWQLPGRALLLGMPLTFAVTAVLARWLVGFSWLDSCLVAAILAPTDPVLAAALVGRREVPLPLRRLLNIESGLNDGLALPAVVFLLAAASHHQFQPLTIFSQVLAGVALGIAIPWIAIRLEQSRYFSASVEYQPLNAFAIGLLVFAACHGFHSNEYLAAFAGGVTVASVGPEVRESFHRFGELVAELLKLAALLVFGALISVKFLAEIPWTGYLFAAATLLLTRPVGMFLSLLGSSLPWRERAVAAWFGPKGFAAVVYGILTLKSGAPSAEEIFHLVAVVIFGSIILHSSTDVLVARMFVTANDEPGTGTGEPSDEPPEAAAE